MILRFETYSLDCHVYGSYPDEWISDNVEIIRRILTEGFEVNEVHMPDEGSRFFGLHGLDDLLHLALIHEKLLTIFIKHVVNLEPIELSK